MLGDAAIGGWFTLTHRDADGRFLWSLTIRNGVTTQGADHLNLMMFKGTTPSPTWYMLLIDDSGYTGVALGDTHASHAGWSEFTQVLSSLRPAWSPASPGGASLPTATATTVQVTSGGSIRGVALVNVSAAGSVSAAGTLYATAVAEDALPVVGGGSLTLQYTINATPVS